MDRSVDAGDPVGSWLREHAGQPLLREGLLDRIELFNTELVARIPELADPDVRSDLAASTTSQVYEFLADLERGGRPADGLADGRGELDGPRELPEAAHNLARTIARRGWPLRVLMQTYRVGQQIAARLAGDIIGEQLMRSQQEHPGQQVPRELERALIVAMHERSISWLGGSLELLTDTYLAELESGFRDTFARRAEGVRDVLSGELADPDEATLRLGYRVAGPHVALVVFSRGGGADALGRFVSAAATRAGGAAVLTVPSGTRGLWAWIGTDSIAPVRGSAELADLASAEGIGVAIGNPGRDLAGMRRSHREAVAARSFADRSASAAGITYYDDVELNYLLTVDAAAADAFVVRELGALRGTDPGVRRLRETVAAYLSALGHADEAARALGVHKNTVRYRIARAEELLGHPVFARRAQLEAALLLADK